MKTEDIVSKNIKRLRESHDMYQDELAAKLGVTQKAVSAWETGKSCPRAGVIYKMCELFDCKMGDIINSSWEDTPVTQHKPVMQIEDSAVESFSDDERRVLKMFRSFTQDKKKKLVDYAIDLMMEGK